MVTSSNDITSVFFHLKFSGYTSGFYPLYNDIYLHISSQSVGCKALLLPDSIVQNPRLDYACSLVLHGHDKQDDAMGFYLDDRKETIEKKSDQVIFSRSFTRNLSFFHSYRGVQQFLQLLHDSPILQILVSVSFRPCACQNFSYK